MKKEQKDNNSDAIIDHLLDRVEPMDNRKVEDRLVRAAKVGRRLAANELSKK